MSETSSSSDGNYALLNTNQSFDIPSNNSVGDQINDPPNEEDVRSEALIKKIHPFVFPKQYNTFDGLPNRGYNATDEPHMMEVKGLEHPSNERVDDRFSPLDQKHPNGNGDLIPMSTHIFDRPSKKHAHFNHGFFDRLHHHNQVFQPGNSCLLGLLNGCDPLVLMGILGFLAYVINSVLSILNRINLPLLTPVTATEMTAAAAAAAAATKASWALRQGIDDQTNESNQRLLKDFERILQMAIGMYEQRVNTN